MSDTEHMPYKYTYAHGEIVLSSLCLGFILSFGIDLPGNYFCSTNVSTIILYQLPVLELLSSYLDQ